MRSLASRITTIILCLMLSMGALALVGCGGGGNDDSNAAPDAQQTQPTDDEQDNCFGDDLPVVNETD